MAERSHPTSVVRGGGRRSYPTPPCPWPGVVAGRIKPTPKELWLHRHRRAYRSYPTLKFRSGGSEEIPLIQVKEQQLHFAGEAVKRYPMPKVRETQVRQ